MSYPAKPVFNTLLHSEFLLSEMAYCAILPVLILDKYHHGSLNTAAPLPQNFEEAFAALQEISRADRAFYKVGRWEMLVNEFINNIAPLFLDFKSDARAVPVLTLPQQRKVKSKNHEDLDKSREIVNWCLDLIFKIKAVRIVCYTELTHYIETVNEFMRGGGKDRASLLSMLGASERNQAAQSSNFCDEPRTPMTQLLLKAQVVYGQSNYESKMRAQVLRGQSKQLSSTTSPLYKGDGLSQHMLAEQTQKLYTKSHTELAAMLDTEEGTMEWLKSYLGQFPGTEDVSFKVDNCYDMKFEIIKEERHVRTKNQPGKVSGELTSLIKTGGVSYAQAPFLYNNANVHIMTNDLVEKCETLFAEFLLPLFGKSSEPEPLMCKIFNKVTAYQCPELQPAFQGALQGKVKQLKFLIDVYKKKPRPASYNELASTKHYQTSAKYFSAAHSFAGESKVRGWLSAIATFEHTKNNLADIILFHIYGIKNMLCEQLADPRQKEQHWLENLLSPLADQTEAFDVPITQATPINRLHLVYSINSLVGFLVKVKTQANLIKGYNFPRHRGGVEQHKNILQQLSMIVTAFSTARDDVTLVDFKRPSSSVETDNEFSIAVKFIIKSFATNGDLQQHLQSLSTANKQQPVYKIENLNKEFEDFIDIDNKFSNNILTSITQVAGIYRAFLKDFQPTT